MQRYLVCSLLLVQATHAISISEIFNPIYTTLFPETEEIILTPAETQKIVNDTLATSEKRKTECEIMMKDQAAEVQVNWLAAWQEFQRKLEVCLQPDAECDQEDLTKFSWHMQERVQNLTTQALAARAALDNRRKKEAELQEANQKVQTGYVDGSVIATGEEEKKRS